MGLEETVGRNERLFEVWSSLLFTLVTPTTKPKDRNVKKKTVGRKERLDEYRLATALTNSQKSVPQYIYYINSLYSGLLGKDFCGLGLQSRAPKKKWGGKEKNRSARSCPGVWAVCLKRERKGVGGGGGNLAQKAFSRGLGGPERSLLQNVTLNSAHVFVERQHLELNRRNAFLVITKKEGEHIKDALDHIRKHQPWPRVFCL